MKPVPHYSVVVAGTFDVFHKGHEDLLDYAIGLQFGIDVILLNGDTLVSDRKKILHSEKKRRNAIHTYLLSTYDCNVPIITTKTLHAWKQQIRKYAPCYLLHGSDWDKKKLSELYGVDESWWEENDIRLIYKDRRPNISSTMIREQMRVLKG